MEAAGEHQNWMTPHGTRTAASPALHLGGDGALAHTWAWLSIVQLEPVPSQTLAGEASSHNTGLKNSSSSHNTMQKKEWMDELNVTRYKTEKIN